MVLISPVTSQNDDLQRTIEQLHYQGAEDILVNALSRALTATK